MIAQMTRHIFMNQKSAIGVQGLLGTIPIYITWHLSTKKKKKTWHLDLYWDKPKPSSAHSSASSSSFFPGLPVCVIGQKTWLQAGCWAFWLCFSCCCYP